MEASYVDAQADESTAVRFYVEIYDVNLTTDTAQVNITVTISKLVAENITPVESIRAMIDGEIDNVEIYCNRNIDGDFVGSSGIISWSLGGAMGKGEYFPFERYELAFRLANILPISPNMSMIKIRELDSFAYFQGTKKAVLSQTFKSTPTNVGPLVEMAFPENSLKAVVI